MAVRVRIGVRGFPARPRLCADDVRRDPCEIHPFLLGGVDQGLEQSYRQERVHVLAALPVEPVDRGEEPVELRLVTRRSPLREVYRKRRREVMNPQVRAGLVAIPLPPVRVGWHRVEEGSQIRFRDHESR